MRAKLNLRFLTWDLGPATYPPTVSSGASARKASGVLFVVNIILPIRISWSKKCSPTYESGGREFESLRARQKSNKYLNNLTARKYAMQNKIICMASAWPRGAWAIGPGRAVPAAQTLLSIQCVEALYFLPQHWSPLTLRSQGMSSGK